MKLTSLIPAFAFAAALGVTPAMAVTINGVELPEAEVNIVTQHCETLAANEEATDDSPDNQAIASAEGTESDSDASSAAIQGETGISGQLLSIDLDTVNIAVCKEAGLIQ